MSLTYVKPIADEQFFVTPFNYSSAHSTLHLFNTTSTRALPVRIELTQLRVRVDGAWTCRTKICLFTFQVLGRNCSMNTHWK